MFCLKHFLAKKLPRKKGICKFKFNCSKLFTFNIKKPKIIICIIIISLIIIPEFKADLESSVIKLEKKAPLIGVEKWRENFVIKHHVIYKTRYKCIISASMRKAMTCMCKYICDKIDKNWMKNKYGQRLWIVELYHQP